MQLRESNKAVDVAHAEAELRVEKEVRVRRCLN
jgi:hypothetical protein